MLEKIPSSLGRSLAGVRAGLEKTALHRPEFADAPDSITVESSAFVDGGALPVSCTADGAGASPPLGWRGAPPEAVSVIVLVEDADSPTPEPLAHAIEYGLGGASGELAEGALDAEAAQASQLGRNSFFRTGWLPPDPPPGHGPHRYLFQVFALDYEPSFDGRPGRGAVVEAMKGHVIAKGGLVGTYQRP